MRPPRDLRATAPHATRMIDVLMLAYLVVAAGAAVISVLFR